MVDLISSIWETERLFVQDAVLENDLENLQILWESMTYVGEKGSYANLTLEKRLKEKL